MTVRASACGWRQPCRSSSRYAHEPLLLPVGFSSALHNATRLSGKLADGSCCMQARYQGPADRRDDMLGAYPALVRNAWLCSFLRRPALHAVACMLLLCSMCMLCLLLLPLRCQVLAPHVAGLCSGNILPRVWPGGGGLQKGGAKGKQCLNASASLKWSS